MVRVLAQKKQQAFTLLEMAVVLVIVALMASFAIKLPPASSKDCYSVTRAQQREIQNALDRYVRANNFYPRPAGRALGVNDPLYGVAASSSAAASIDRIGGGSTAVLVGALPFATLGLNGRFAADCWGNKFTYYVSDQLVTNTTYMDNDSAGHITVRTGTLSTPSTLTGSAAYAVVSHGANALGASPRNYTADKKLCNTEQSNGSLSRIDKENCDSNNREVFSADFNNGNDSAQFFDDLVVYSNKTGFTGCNSAVVTWSTCSATVIALQNQGSTNVENTAGGYTGTATVSCNNGTLNVSGLSCTSTSSCTGQPVNWAPGCSGTVGNLSHGGTTSVNNTASGYSGSVTVNCSGGTISQEAPNCTPSTACTPRTVNWGAGCSASLAELANGASVLVNNSTSGHSGSATASCSGGNVTLSDANCEITNNCNASTTSWGNCSGSYAIISHNSSRVVNNTVSGFSGSVTLTCMNGVISQNSASCGPASGNCSAASVTWGSGCSAMAPATNNGATSASFNNTASGYVGSATASCNNGTLTASGTCTQHCASQNVVWSTNCSANAAALNHNSSSTLTNTNAGYTGSLSVTCNNGTLTQSSATCTPSTYGNNQCGGSIVAPMSCAGGYAIASPTDMTCPSHQRLSCTSQPCGGNGDYYTCSCVNDPSCAASSGDCQFTSPRNGITAYLMDGQANSYGSGVCARYSCCGANNVVVTNLSPCPNGDEMDVGANCQGSRQPHCYERDGEPGDDLCGVYHYTNGDVVGDMSPCDYSGANPPSGWSFCMNDGGGAFNCHEDTYICQSSNWCDACCNNTLHTVNNPWGQDKQLTEGGGCALAGMGPGPY